MSTNVIISRKNWFSVKDHPAKWMIWEGEPVRGTVEKLKLIGVDSLVFDPCLYFGDAIHNFSSVSNVSQNYRTKWPPKFLF